MAELRMGGPGPDDTVADPNVAVPRGRDRILEPGTAVGRYVVLAKIGAGGMGVVYAAYDPELDRKVALKRLHGARSAPESRSEGRSRLVREAQAMARLSHPNVVAVHDVGVHDGRVFLAMEYVDGQTLGAFMRGQGRPWPEMLRVMIAAGRGLAAAHEAGLIHRDFKPDNVLIRDGTDVKVTDFGLALEKTVASGESSPSSAVPVEIIPGVSRSGPIDVSMSEAGTVVGTPAYMAPEQQLGLPTDPRTDQFSFCVVAYAALYGERPFEGAPGAPGLAAATGAVNEPPAGSEVPTWLRQVLLRGLHQDPADRFPSMEALLDAMGFDPTRRGDRRLRWVVAGAAIAALGVGWAALREDQALLCADSQRHLTGVWDDAARASLRRSFEAAQVGFIDSSIERVNARLDAYTSAWVEQRRESCEATQLRGEQSHTLMDLRMECLDERLQAVRLVVAILAEADVTAVENAVVAVSDLPDLARCSDAAALRAVVPPPDPEVAKSVAALRGTLAEARAHGSTGQYKVGLALARETIDPARATNYAPVLVDALHRRGHFEHKLGNDEAAEASLTEAFFIAVESQLPEAAGLSAKELTSLVGRSRARSAEGRRWADHARAQAGAARIPLLRSMALHALAGVAHEQGEYDEARTLALEAMEIRSAQLGPRTVGELASLNMLGLIASDSGQYVQAQAHFEEGLALGQELLGADHPNLASLMNNMAKIALRQGKLDAAEAAFERALQLQVHAMGPGHRNVAQLHNNLAAVAASRGDYREAQRRFAVALEIWERALGSEHPKVADGLNNLAVMASKHGRFEDARAYDERALAIRERTMAPDHPGLARAYNNLADDLKNLGQVEDALVLHHKALSMWEGKLGPTHDDVADGLTGVGEDLVLMGRATEAVPRLERALAIREPLGLDAADLGHTQWNLARALWDAPTAGGRDRVRAKVLAEHALTGFEGGGEAQEASRVRTWLEDR